MRCERLITIRDEKRATRAPSLEITPHRWRRSRYRERFPRDRREKHQRPVRRVTPELSGAVLRVVQVHRLDLPKQMRRRAGVAWPFYAGVAGAASHLFWQIRTVDLDDPEDCAAKFRSNAAYGAMVFASAVAGKAFA